MSPGHAHADRAPDGILAGKRLLRQRLVDDRDRNPLGVLGVGEVPPTDQARAHRGEVVSGIKLMIAGLVALALGLLLGGGLH